MLQIAIGVGADELAPEMFICVDHGDHRGGNWCFRLDGQRVAALIAEFRVFLILLLALRAGFHLPENSTIKTPPGTEAWRLRLPSCVLISSCFHRQAYATFPYFTKGYVYYGGGIAVNILGHGHPDLVHAIQQQAAQLIHTSNLYYTEPQVKLGQMLVEHSFADKVFFCNGGAEANEAAIK